jgi:GxxExxY protein
MDLNAVTEKIIGCSIDVHRALEPGLLENIYEQALCVELDNVGLFFERQKQLPVIYKGRQIGKFRLDLVVEDRVVVELKAADRMDSLFQAQLLGYMRLGSYPLGLLINFNSQLLKQGIKRIAI